MEEFQEGNTIARGKYRLTRKIGEGTYGVVWLAEEIALGMRVAIKRLHPHTGRMSDLRREAATQARLNHQNIVAIHDFDEDERIIVMEYIEGQSLEMLLKKCIAAREWIDLDVAKEFMSQCCAALACAHRESVIHGDIKPGNIIITAEQTVKLSDFGVAKVILEREGNSYSQISGTRLGSLSYMAPEVLRGEPRDFKSDIFSFGVVCYLLLTGCHPFYNTHPSGLFTVRDMLLSDEEPKDAREIVPNLPDAYADVVTRMMEKDRERRYDEIRVACEDILTIGLACPNCETKSPLSNRYCGQCGHSLKSAIDSLYKGKSYEELCRVAYQLNCNLHFREAIGYCDAAILIQPEKPAAYQSKGFALSSLERFDGALQNFGLALEYADLKPVEAQIHYNLSYVFWCTGDKENQIRELEKALECNPDHLKAKEFLEKYRKE